MSEVTYVCCFEQHHITNTTLEPTEQTSQLSTSLNLGKTVSESPDRAYIRLRAKLSSDDDRGHRLFDPHLLGAKYQIKN